MLLNAELIDKLMSNRTLVSLMSSQLKRVIDTERMTEEEKRRIVRQVFDQMMEERVDFSMNNVRLAVKTVSSSYRAAADRQRQLQLQRLSSGDDGSAAASQVQEAASEQPGKKETRTLKKKQQQSVDGTKQQKVRSKMDLKGSFGRRSGSTSTTTTTSTVSLIDAALNIADGDVQSTASPKATTDSSKSKSKASSSRQTRTAKRNQSLKKDASGNPIVVVLLPQDKAAAAA